ncbi:hypothetical protein KEM55_005221 [Ascosphaera atra]|nr:hypothetical protein KEM55_005221 [Ascosphaera atra]
MEVQIEGRPKDNIVQWLLSVHEPAETSRNAAALADEALLKPKPKPPKPKPAPEQHKLKKPSQTNCASGAVKKPAPKSSSDDLLLLSDSDLLPTPTPKRRTKTVLTPRDKDKVAERFERRARHKTREDKYEPKKEKEKEKKKRERRVTERQSKTKTKERKSKSEQHEHAAANAKKRGKAQGRPLKRLSSAIEENFKARNVSQERLTGYQLTQVKLSNNLDKGLFGRGKASRCVSKTDLPDLSFSEMGFLLRSSSRRRSRHSTSDATRSRSPAKREERPPPKDDISRYFSQEYKSPRDDSRHHHHHRRPSKLRSPHCSPITIISPRDRNARSTSFTRTSDVVKRRRRDSYQTPTRRKASSSAILRSRSTTVVYSWSPSERGRDNNSTKVPGANKGSSPPIASGGVVNEEYTPVSGAASSLNSSLLSRTRRKAFQNAFVGQNVEVAREGGDCLTLEDLQRMCEKSISSAEKESTGVGQVEEGGGAVPEAMLEKQVCEQQQMPGHAQLPDQGASKEEVANQNEQHRVQETACTREEVQLETELAMPQSSAFQPASGFAHPMTFGNPEDMEQTQVLEQNFNSKLRHMTPGQTNAMQTCEPFLVNRRTDAGQERETMTPGQESRPFYDANTNETAQGVVSNDDTPALMDKFMEASPTSSDVELFARVLGQPPGQTQEPSGGAVAMQNKAYGEVNGGAECGDGECYCDACKAEVANQGARSRESIVVAVAQRVGIGDGRGEMARPEAPVGFWRPNRLY